MVTVDEIIACTGGLEQRQGRRGAARAHLHEARARVAVRAGAGDLAARVARNGLLIVWTRQALCIIECQTPLYALYRVPNARIRIYT